MDLNRPKTIARFSITENCVRNSCLISLLKKHSNEIVITTPAPGVFYIKRAQQNETRLGLFAKTIELLSRIHSKTLKTIASRAKVLTIDVR